MALDKGYNKALNYAFLLLRYRQRAVQELKNRLKRKKYPQRDIKQVIAYLKEYRYLNDKEFARSFTREKIRRGFGEKRITFDLRRLGVSSGDIQEALTLARQEMDENEVLRGMLHKLLEKKKDKNKVIGYLLRRGFAYGSIMRVLDED